VLKECHGLDAIVKLPMIGIELPISEIYAKVDFSEPQDVT
jgi:hypothetical protein